MGDSRASLPCHSQLSGVLECIPDPAILIDPARTILAANTRYRRQLADGALIEGRRCYQASHNLDRPCDELGEACPIRSCARHMSPSRVLHLHETERGPEHQDVTAYPLTDADGSIRGFIEIVHRNPVASPRPSAQLLVGRSPAFNRMMDLVQRVARRPTTVLLLGESGTGKELVANAVHQLSDRRDGPFVPVDCSGLSESLFESELFGHEKGAFTGAISRKLGLVEAADGGTLFLDEVGDIPLNLQVKLLRLIETGRFRRVGSVESNRSEFRLVGATHRDLEAMVRDGTFRRDLYYRLSVYPVFLPPLRERRADLALLVDSLLRRLDERCSRLSTEALHTLSGYAFPGNVRELLNILERACLLADGDTILPEHLPSQCFGGDRSPALAPASDILPLADVEARYLRWAVARHGGDNAALASKLGIGERTFYRKLERIRRSRDNTLSVVS